MSSWWAALHGYAHPALDAAAKEQLGRMSHVMFGGLTHEPAVTLADRLAALAPAGLEHVFLCDSGSVSVEVAVKMCLQYWRSRGRPAKNRLLTWRGGYHGDTFMAMSVCDPEGGMHRMWDGVLPRQVFAGLPPAGFAAGVDEAYADELRELIRQHCATGWPTPRAGPASPTSGCSARSAWCSLTARSTSRPPRRRRCGPGSGCGRSAT